MVGYRYIRFKEVNKNLKGSLYKKNISIHMEIGNIGNFVFKFSLLCKGSDTKAWGAGGLDKAHSKLVYDLFNKVCNKSLKN